MQKKNSLRSAHKSDEASKHIAKACASRYTFYLRPHVQDKDGNAPMPKGMGAIFTRPHVDACVARI